MWTAPYRAATLLSTREVCRSAEFVTITVHDTTSFCDGLAEVGLAEPTLESMA